MSRPGPVLLVGVGRQDYDVGRFESITTDRLAQAVEVLDNIDVSLVITALDLVDSTGLSTLQRLRHAAKSTPIVVSVSGGDEDRELIRRAVAEGAAGYLPVPITDPVLLQAYLMSVLEKEKHNTEFRARANRVARAVDGSGDGLWDWDVARDDMFLSARCSALLGFEEKEGSGDPGRWFDRVHPDDLSGLRNRMDAVLEGGSPVFVCEHRILNGFGEPHWVMARGKPIRDLEGCVTGVAGFLSDVTDRRRTEQEAIHRSLHDGLTGLASRSLFMDRVARALAALHRRDGGHFAILFVDLDYFKEVNDLHGHSVGDAVLREVGRRLESLLRLGDTVGRIGGDEFGVMLAEVCDAGAAVHVADRVIDLLSDPIAVGRNEFVVSASIGITISTTGYVDAAAMIHDADLAMYRAKSRGRARSQVCDPQMHAAAIARLRLEAELQEAVVGRCFEVHYQPVVDLGTGRVAGVEAMFRWRHPEIGLITPSEFIDVAEKTGLIVEIGWWVLRESCRQMVMWRRRFELETPLWLCVNISAKFLLQEGMTELLGDLLRHEELSPEHLILDVTEDLALNYGDRASEVLEDLRSKGIRLCLDDFGSGYASLSHLDRLNYDMLKIDPSIVECLNGGAADDRLLVTVMGLARQMGLQVVAEGVETSDQARGLRQRSCKLAQGHWFARPSLPDEISDLIVSPPNWWLAATGD